ncbi:MAG: hypothetical protein K0U79_16435 [Gammaproteobacteria bacterium]|nr:hypothetical protein [Gammaproteobacteria bacterium]
MSVHQRPAGRLSLADAAHQTILVGLLLAALVQALTLHFWPSLGLLLVGAGYFELLLHSRRVANPSVASIPTPAAASAPLASPEAATVAHMPDRARRTTRGRNCGSGLVLGLLLGHWLFDD